MPKADNRPLVSVMVLNHNGIRYLKSCFESLSNASYPNCELVLVDNLSTDDSVTFIQQNFPEVRVIQTHENAGFSRAYNLAFKETSGKYIVLLNNDVEVSRDWLEHMVAVAEADESIGALQPKIRSMIDPGYFEYAGASGGYIDKYGYPFLRGRIFYHIEYDNAQYDDEAEVFWTSGAAMFIRAEALEQSGPLDETFIYHMEEIDLCWRLHMAGYRLKVVPRSVIYHYVGASLKTDSYLKLYWNHRNNIMMLIKNLDSRKLVATLAPRYFLDFINLFFSLLKLNPMHFVAILHAHFWILTHLGSILKKRRKVQVSRRKADHYFSHLVYTHSVVIDYFLLRRKKFSDLKHFNINQRGSKRAGEN